MKTLNPRDRRALLLGGVGVAVLVAYVLAIEPAIGWYSDLTDEHRVLAARLARHQYENAETRYYAEAVKEWESEAEPLTPPKAFDEQATLVGEKVITAAQKNQVTLKNTNWTSPAPWPEEPTLAMAILHLEAEANWEPVFKFIAAVYGIQGVLSVEEMELTGDPKKGGKLSLSLRISVLVQADREGNVLWAS